MTHTYGCPKCMLLWEHSGTDQSKLRFCDDCASDKKLESDPLYWAVKVAEDLVGGYSETSLKVAIATTLVLLKRDTQVETTEKCARIVEDQKTRWASEHDDETLNCAAEAIRGMP